MNKNILLTGGSGFIGSHFHKVLPNDRLVNFDLEEPSFKHNATFVKGDIRNKANLKIPFKKFKVDTILSLAAKHHDFGIGHDEYFDTNEYGVRNLCQLATENSVNKMIFYSSVAVYGVRSEVSTEYKEPIPESPYGASKLAGENILINWAMENSARKVLIIRPTLVFGPNNNANMHNLIRQIDSGLYFHLGKADNIKSIAYVENLVQATMFLMERMKPGVAIYNYADEPHLSSREIGDIIATALKKKIRITVPKTFGIMMGIPFDLMIKITGKNLPISTARIKKLGTQTYHSAQKIFSEGFTPPYTTIEGLNKMVEWYKSKAQVSSLEQK